MTKCKLRKECNYYRKESFICNNIHKPYYCGKFRYMMRKKENE